MKALVKKVYTTVVFHFKNGDTYNLPLSNNENNTLLNYGTSASLSEQLCAISSDNIIGNISGNTFSLELKSKDGLLIPNNENSKYFGYMNDTCYLEITCSADNEDIYMGRYFVDTWEAGSSSSNYNAVSISCVDLISKIKNITLQNLRFKRNISFKDFLKYIIDKLNSTLPESMKILYTDDDLDIYKNSDYTWQMYFNNIDRDDIETMFNCIAKYTISYLWINRDMYLKTDHLLDDTVDESVCSLSGQLNLLEYGNQSGDIDKYSGVSVKYINDINYIDKEILSLTDINLYKGSNELLDKSLNTDKVIDIHTIEIICASGSATCTSFDKYKNKINMYIESTTKTTATVKVYGTVADENYNTNKEYIDNNYKSEIVEIENRLLRKELICTYTDGLISIMKMKNNKVYCNGYINPKIKLGDTVFVQGKNMNINNYYKVIGLDYTLGTSYRCKASLIRVISTTPNVNDILFQQNDLLYNRLTGIDIDSAELKDITENENIICEQQLAVELSALRKVLNGGA